MGRAVVRLLAAAAAAFVLSFPIAGVRGTTTGGFSVAWQPPLICAVVVFVAGAVFLAGDAAVRALGGPRVPSLPLPAVRWGGWVLAAVVAALPLLGLSSGWTTLLLETMVFATIAVGLQITIGMSGLLVLGHAGFWAVGAYTFGVLVLQAHWNFWPAWAAAGAVAALIGFLVGLPALRLRGDYLAIVTLGFGESIRWIITNLDGITGGTANLPSPDIPGSFWEPKGWLGTWMWQPGAGGGDIDRDCYWTALALLVVCVVCVGLLARSRVGRALFALREDETAARCMGIDTTRAKLVAFTSSAMWAGLAGAVTATARGSIHPDLFDFNTSVLFVAMVVLGGLGSVPGALVGAALLWIVPQKLQDIEALKEVTNFRPLFFGALMAAMMVVRPEGILGRFAARGRKVATA